MFMLSTEEHLERERVLCEDAIAAGDAEGMVEHTTLAARLANRVLQVARQEAENSEDPAFIASVNKSADLLQASLYIHYCFFFI